MQAENEQAPRMEHAEEAFLTLHRCHPQQLEFVCSPWQPLCQEETSLVPQPRSQSHGEPSPVPVHLWSGTELALLWPSSHMG